MIPIVALLVLSTAVGAQPSAAETVAISGNGGLPGVAMDGLPGRVVTDYSGFYSADVPLSWSGRVIPAKEGYAFDPPSREYASIRRDRVNDSYSARVLEYRISGSVGVAGVAMQGLPDRVMTDSSGRYVAMVPYGWTGAVSPTKEGCIFQPLARAYDSVAADEDNQDYRPVEGFGVIAGLPLAAEELTVLVIPTTEVDAAKFAQTQEDMRVMVQILRESLSERTPIFGLLPDYGDYFGAGGRRTEALYIQGYGALFVMEVDFSLSPPPAPNAEARVEREPEADPVWQRARQKLYAPRGRQLYAPEETRPMDLDRFKEDLSKMLRHAANIRHIDPNEKVVLTILGQAEVPAALPTRGSFSSGGGGGFQGGSYSVSGSSFGPGGGQSYADSQAYSSGSATRRPRRGPATPGPATVLTIQAGKVDIDAYAKGDIDFETFQKRVNVFSY